MRTLSIKDIKANLDKSVLGQESAKEELSKAFWLHMYQASQEERSGEKLSRQDYIPPHLLLTGPTGCGKTELVTSLCEAYSWPMVTVDMSVVTPSGYVGTTFSEVLYNSLIESFSASTRYCDYTVIFCDEFDKVVSPGSTTDMKDFKKAVQYEFLKILETGALDKNASDSSRSKDKYDLDLSRCMFVMAGNFPETRKENVKKGLGFGQETVNLNEGKSLIQRLTDTGMANQLAGRVSFVGELSRLDKDTLTKIVNGEGALARGINKLAKDAGITITNEVKEMAVNSALESLTGARGLRYTLVKTVLDELYRSNIAIDHTKFHDSDEVNKINYQIKKAKQELTTHLDFSFEYRANIVKLKTSLKNMDDGNDNYIKVRQEIQLLQDNIHEADEYIRFYKSEIRRLERKLNDIKTSIKGSILTKVGEDE